MIAAALAGIAIVAGEAHAQDAAEPIAIDYDAPSGCPERAAFAGEIFARTKRAREAGSQERARVLHVRVERRGERHAGRLWIDEGAAREVAGTSCAEVVGALGLVAALAVDPQASLAPRPAPPAGAETAPSAPTPSGASAQDGDAAGERERDRDTQRARGDEERERERARERARVRDHDRAPERPRGRPREGERTRMAVGAGGEAAAIADVVLAGRLFAELDLRGALFAPSLRLAVARSLEVERTPALGAATLTWTQAELDGCPLRLDLFATLSARPCAAFGLGVLQAEGAGVVDARSRSRPWVQTGAHGRLVWAVLARFAVEVEGGVVVPLLRESFFFEPSVPIYEAPPIAGVFRAAALVRFP